MKVWELIHELQQYDDDCDVYVNMPQSDGGRYAYNIKYDVGPEMLGVKVIFITPDLDNEV